MLVYNSITVFCLRQISKVPGCLFCLFLFFEPQTIQTKST